MNKLSILFKSLLITIGMTKVAHANDRWTAFYAGVDAGVVFNNVELKSQQLGFTNPGETCNISSNFSSFSPGVQLGYMYQFAKLFVSGIEANVVFNTNQKDTLSCNSDINADIYDRFIFRNRMQTSVKGRIGFVVNKNIMLPYLTVGASFVGVGLTYKNEGGDYYSNSNIKAGWLIGAGLEWAFQEHWSLRGEYNYSGYGTTINLKIPSIYGLLDPNGKSHADLNTNNILVSVNYLI